MRKPILATLVYLKRNGKTLMLMRNKKPNDYHKGNYMGLGGKFLPGETPEACAIREAFEESGYKISNPLLKGMITFPLFDGKSDWYVFLFTATEFTGDEIDSPEGSLKWIPDKMLSEIQLWEGDYLFMPWLIDSRSFTACVRYQNGRLIRHSVTFYPIKSETP